MNAITGYLSNQFDSNVPIKGSYASDYLGSVQLLEKAGFSPFAEKSVIGSTLYQVFDRFVKKTGLDTTANKLKDEYLQDSPSSQHAMNIYSILENTFTPKGPGEKAAIVNFLNSKIDEFVSTKDTDTSGSLTLEESGINESIFKNLDTNRDNQINASEMKKSFYEDFKQLNYVLDYFQNTPGTLVDTYA